MCAFVRNAYFQEDASVIREGSEQEEMVSEIFVEKEGDINEEEENSEQEEVTSEHEPELMSADSEDVSVSDDRVRGFAKFKKIPKIQNKLG